MKATTLCYIEHEGKYLMLLRNKKENDYNEGKWIGVGGKFIDGEGPEQCLVREVYEETGLELRSWKYRGIVTFVSDIYETEFMHVFISEDYTGSLKECSEGTLEWIEKCKIPGLNLWEGDRIFMKPLIEDSRFFSVRLEYSGDKLVSDNIYFY